MADSNLTKAVKAIDQPLDKAVAATDIVAASAGKSALGKLATKIAPGAGSAMSAKDAYLRWQQGDRTGAVIDALASVGWLLPGPAGWVVGGGLDLLGVGRDMYNDREQEAAAKPQFDTRIMQLQNIIGAKPDGIFGPETRGKLIAWQTQNGLKADGIPGPQTYKKAGIAEGTIMKQQTLAESIAELRARLESIESGQYDQVTDEGVFSTIGKGLKDLGKGFKTGVAPTNAASMTGGVNAAGGTTKAGEFGAALGRNKGKLGLGVGAALGAGAATALGGHDHDPGPAPKPRPHPKPHPHNPVNNIPTPAPTPTPSPVSSVDAAGDKELADLKAQILALTSKISQSANGNPEALQSVTNIANRMNSLG